MADWIDDQAVESETEGFDDEEERPPKKLRRRIISDDEEEEEDETDAERIKEEFGSFIVDDEDVEEDDDKKSEDDDDEDSEEIISELEEEDKELLKENLGFSIRRKKRRVEIGSDSDESENADRFDRVRIKRESSDREQIDIHRNRHISHRHVNYADEERSDTGEESGLDDFIQDDDEDEDSGLKRQRRKRRNLALGVSEGALEEARDLFGVDFNVGEFFADDDVADEEDYDEDDDYEEAGEDEELRQMRIASRRRRHNKHTLLEEIEPVELQRRYLLDEDKRIQLEDRPERFQLRSVPVTEAEPEELLAEAKWIFKTVFNCRSLSCQEERSASKSNSALERIREVLGFIRNMDYEVPFIAFYRKEHVQPYLKMKDLWKIYHCDEQWCSFREKKQLLRKQLERMREYQLKLKQEHNTSDEVICGREVRDGDFDVLSSADTVDELNDWYAFFSLHYSRLYRTRTNEMIDLERTGKFKMATGQSQYTQLLEIGLGDLADKFGLTAEQFAENLEVGYCRNEVTQLSQSPHEIAEQYIVGFLLPNVDSVLKGAKWMVAMRFGRNPIVRKIVREQYRQRVTVSVRATMHGRSLIDEAHPLYTCKYLKNKPVRLLKNDEYLRLKEAEENYLIKMTFSMDGSESKRSTYYNELLQQQLFHKDEYTAVAEEWNNLRHEALKQCLDDVLYPVFEHEVRLQLQREAEEHVIEKCANRMQEWLRIAPYWHDPKVERKREDYNRLTILGIAYSSEPKSASYAALVNADGDVLDHLVLRNFTKRTFARSDNERELKTVDLEEIKIFIEKKLPIAIAITGESIDAVYYKKDLESLVVDLQASGTISKNIPVEIVDPELARVYAESGPANQEFPTYPVLLRQAISIARRLQDPLIEFSQLVTPDDEILSLKFHPSQNMVSKEELIQRITEEFINRVSEVGVDVNRCIEHPYTAPLLQFVCGLGPRKASHLLKILTPEELHLENRSKLVTHCRMGPKVFMNCAGFIKIDTARMMDKSGVFIDVLDGSRVHPETYEWARKMAFDALEYDESVDDYDPGTALDEILESPERLKDLDLDAFAEELQRQGFGNKNITLYDIRAELNHRYKDLRALYHPPTREQLFYMLIKETPRTFGPGKLIMARVLNVVYKRPSPNMFEEARPVKDSTTNLWQCPICFRDDFPELGEVWKHYDANECPGQAIGVRVRLENGIAGFIPIKYLSDRHVNDPNERVKSGMTIACRIMKIDTYRFSCDLTCRTSDLEDREFQYGTGRDNHYDFKSEEEDRKKEETARMMKNDDQIYKRVIAHPSFRNCTCSEAEALLDKMDEGDAIIRPSSKGADFLTLTWKVCDGIYQHVSIREENKENSFSLGRSLIIGSEVYEDLDEILARFVHPVAMSVREVLTYKYYRDSNGGDTQILDNFLIEEKQRNGGNKIPYSLSACKDYPGKFLLSYLPNARVRHEYFTALPDGFRFRGRIFNSLNSLLAWFKQHFNEPPPGTPLATPTDRLSVTGYTPSQYDSLNRMGIVTPRGAVSIGTNAWNSTRSMIYLPSPSQSSFPGQSPATGVPRLMRTPQFTVPPTPSDPYLGAQQPPPAIWPTVIPPPA
ncbi:Transcription elongation factor SPT6 [Trichinella pseudospiralis]|uniref:Suppressor of Ty 6 homolog n=1 Tax=Trichinella pseudospiralis TaxID=6337 RepID=A0A0V1FU34_TRIPS|nr:Transcription elongation factor SPT6 [Trichinella pseudospiralis]